MSSLGKRVLTALVLVPAVLGAVLALPTAHFSAVMAAVTAAGAWEWAGLMGWRSRAARSAYTLAVVLALGAAHWAGGAVWAVVLAGCVWWVVALVWVLRYQQGLVPVVGAAGRVAAGALVLVPTWASLVALHGAHGRGPWLVLALLFVIWAADTGAYFAGRRFGRRKLASRVSPGKTWEGAAGGLALAAPVALAGGMALGLSGPRLAAFVALGLLVVPVSILGDLAESLFKREANVKDSGKLLPGHGGLLDRIDSLTAAAPVFALGLLAAGLLG